MDPKTQKAIQDIHTGNLKDRLSNNMKYATTGVFVGVVVGVIAATVLKKNRVFFGVGGAVVGGTIGAILPKSK